MDIKDVEKLAELARIELNEEEKMGILEDMKGILGYVNQITEIKLDDVKTEYSLTNVYREDAVEAREFSKDLISGQFPDSQNGFLKVKKIL